MKLKLRNLIKEQLLFEEEKKYLEAVLRPFKENIRSIAKLSLSLDYSKEFLSIIFSDNCVMNFPDYECGKYYKNLKLGEFYTLEELKLFEGEEDE